LEFSNRVKQYVFLKHITSLLSYLVYTCQVEYGRQKVGRGALAPLDFEMKLYICLLHF